MDPRRLLLLLLAPLFGFRLWLAAALPVTGDEAYFIWWGWVPDWGYYDHPPMVGWWLAAQHLLGDAAWWLRLTSVLQPFVLCASILWFVPRIWPGVDEQRRWWAALLVLLAPTSVWNVLITTDTPLVYFAVLSGLAWLRAGRDGNRRWYAIAGVLLAGAVLSKYFAAFLGFAFLVDAAAARSRRTWTGLAIVYACTVPALLLMAWWNAGHCWPNYMFNFVNRHGNAALSWKTPLLYAVVLFYLLTPLVVWGLRRAQDYPVQGVRSLGLLAGVPLLLFGLLSLVKTVGLHWVLSFIPFVFIAFALRAPRDILPRAGKFMLGFALLHVLAFIAISFMPLETWRRAPWYDSIVLATRAPQLVARVVPEAVDYTLMSDGYADAVTLGYNARRYFGVFGEASSHARHDDILTDFSRLDGRNLLILRKSAPSPGEYEPYFREVSSESFVLNEVGFHVIRGRGFDYPHYRDTVLAMAKRKYYALPKWLPQCGCYFCDRYFPGQTCQR